MSCSIAGRVPAPLCARIAVGDIELVLGLAVLAIDEAAQTVEIRLRHAEKQWRMLRSRADQADKALRQILTGRNNLCFASRLGLGALRRRELSAGGQRRPQQRGEDASPVHCHVAGLTISGLSSPSPGASLAKGGRAPSKESGSPTNDSPLPSPLLIHRWITPRAAVCSSATTWSTVWIGPFGIPAASSRAAQAAIRSPAKRSARIGISARRLTTRSPFVRKRGSSARSGRPIAVQSRRNRLSLPAA